MRHSRPRLVIVGAGIGGLTTAIALRQIGLDVVVLEKTAVLRPVGFGIMLQSNAIQALARIGMAEVVRRAGVPIKRAKFCLHQGRPISEIPMERLIRAGEASESWGVGKRFGFLPVDTQHLYCFATQTTQLSAAELDSSRLPRNFSLLEIAAHQCGFQPLTPGVTLLGDHHAVAADR